VAPRLTQALLTLLHDGVIWAFACKYYPAPLQRSILAVSMLSWFNNFTHTRPFSNSLESTLHLACLCLWPLPSRGASSAATVTARAPGASQDCMSQQPGEPADAQHRGHGGAAGATRRRRRADALCCAGACCVIRPTSAALFVPLALYEAWIAARPEQGGARVSWKQRAAHAATLALDAVVLAAAFLGGAALVDRCFYGRWVCPTWENIRFNVLHNGSAAFGAHPWHWYFSQGLPAMLASLLPLVLVGIAASARANVQWRHQQKDGSADGVSVQGTAAPAPAPLWPALLALWGTAVHSAIPHKEFRFVLPSFELLLPYAAVPLQWACAQLRQRDCHPAQDKVTERCGDVLAQDQSLDGARQSDAQRHRGPSSARQRAVTRQAADALDREAVEADVQRHGALPGARRRTAAWWRSSAAWLVLALAVLQLPMLAYLGLVHQRGTIAASEWLASADLASVRIPPHHTDVPPNYACPKSSPCQH
jgi:Alg9-like mannosyltransferase family